MDSYIDVIFNKTIHDDNASEVIYDEVEASRANHEAIIVPLVFLIIFVVGVVGNGTILYLVAKYRELKTVPYMLIVNLSTADLLINVICVPFTSTIYTLESWQFGTFICKLNEFSQTVVVSVSIFTLCALSIERYMIVSQRQSRDVMKNRRYVIITMVAIWITAVVFGLPDLISANVQDYEFQGEGTKKLAICMPHPTPANAYYNEIITIVKFLYLFFLPMSIISIFYSLMAVHLCSNSAEVRTQQYTQESTEKSLVDRVAKKGHVQKRRLHLAKLVLSLCILFVICWLPRHIYLIWWHFSPSYYNAFWHYFKIIGFCLTFIMSAVNPVVIYLMDSVVNRYVKKHLFCCCFTETEELTPLGEEDMELSILPTMTEQTAQV